MIVPVVSRDEINTFFKENKAVTVDDLATRLRRSVPTIRRRLKEWKAHTSYNQNSRYYTLPGIPEFDQYGLWKHRNIFFSKHGTLKNTIGALIHQSPAGLNAFDLDELLDVPTRVLLSQLNNNGALCRERYQGVFVYFSGQIEISEQQRIARKKAYPSIAPYEPLSDQDAIVVLVELIRHSNDDAERLTRRVRRRGVNVSTTQIRDLLVRHGIKKKSGLALLKSLKAHIDGLMESVAQWRLFREIPTIEFEYEGSHCSCGKELTVLKTRMRTIATTGVGRFHSHETVMCCAHCQRSYGSNDLKRIAPKGGRFGFDVLVHVGMAMFVKCRNEQNIKAELNSMGIPISRSEVGNLGRRFVIYLAQAHQEAQPQIKKYLNDHGGYILHLDGTCEGDSAVLVTGLDGIAGIVLGNIKARSESRESLVPFLRRLEQNYGTPLALVHDMGTGILGAIAVVFPETPDYVCHFHFLRDIGKDLLQHENSMIRSILKRHRIRTVLSEQARTLRKLIEADKALTQSLLLYHGAKTQEINEKLPLTICAYLLILWILDANSQLDGYGFPFDRAELVFCERLDDAYFTICNLQDSVRNQALTKLYCVVLSVARDDQLSRLINMMNKKVVTFERLRDAMRIATPAEKQGLNDPGVDVDLGSIKRKVSAFRQSEELEQAALRNIAYQGMIKQIDKYWEKLFVDPIFVKTSTGHAFVQPQRTNNMSEHFFRALKKDHRKKSGTRSLTRTLQAMIADTPLIKNLECPEYMRVILNGREDLAARFAEIDIRQVRQELERNKDREERIPLSLKKMLRKQNFATRLAVLSGQ